MKHKLIFAAGVIVLGWAVFAVVPAEAAEAAGPYYATPSWDQTLPASTRFIVLTNMSSAAVLDRETGLVWEKSPSTSTFTWENAQFHCNQLTTGGRLGWRMPTIQELSSLVDQSQSNPALPSGHPFSNVSSVFSYVYLSATSLADGTTGAITTVKFYVNFGGGNVGTVDWNYPNSLVWCVRGGQGVDPQ